MAKTTQMQEQTMEEILASIRRIISDDEARGTPARPSPPRPVSNVSHLFAEPSPLPSATVVELPIEPAPAADADLPEDEDYAEADEPPAAAEVAIDEAAFAAALEPEEPTPQRAELAPEPRRDPPPPASQPLLSPRADAAVSSAFGNLADTFFSAHGRTVESLVEDMLRPMLKTWLDHNLPPLVERLVREEIERVARRRR
jgi:cell pole-organizing protein PopZ